MTTWTNLNYRGFGWYATWYDRLPRQPHVVSVCTVAPTVEPLTLDEAKLASGFVWTSGDAREPMLTNFVKAARAKVEFDTGLALLTQTRAVYLDVVTSNVIVLPEHCMPLQEVTSIVTIDTSGNAVTLDPATYIVDFVSGRIFLAPGASWPTNLRSVQAWTITIVAGWPDPDTLANEAPVLRQLVHVLVAHTATQGRDLVTTAPAIHEVPLTYSELLAPYQPIAVI